METKKKICPKCGQEDGSGQNKIHDMNPEHFVKCDIRTIMERDGVCYHCAFWIRMYGQHKNDPNWLIIDGVSYIANPFVTYKHSLPLSYPNVKIKNPCFKTKITLFWVKNIQ